MKKDILIMCQFFYPEYVSSAMLPYQTALELISEGFSVGVLTGYPKEYNSKDQVIPKKEKVAGIEITRKKYLQLGRKGFFSRIINYFSFTFILLLNIFKTRQYKAIIVYSNPPILPIVAIVANKIFDCKIIFVAYDLYPEIAIRTKSVSSDSSISKVMNKINNSLFSNASGVIALSEEMKNFIVQNRNLNPNLVSVIPNWATETFKECLEIKSTCFKQIQKKYQLIVSYFGNMGTAQDIDTLMEVMRDKKIQASSIAFIFAGHGNKKEGLKKFIIENKLENIFVFDFLSGQEFNDALQISDLFVVSLTNGLSGLAVPSKTYSYYQAQKPVLAIMEKNTDIAKEIIEYQAGFSIENGQVEKLSSELLELCENLRRLINLTKNVSRLYHDKYQKKEQLKKYSQLIGKLLEEV